MLGRGLEGGRGGEGGTEWRVVEGSGGGEGGSRGGGSPSGSVM